MRARDFLNEKRRKKKKTAGVLYYGYPWGYYGDSSGDSGGDGGVSENTENNEWTQLRLPNYPEDAYVKFQDGRALIAGDNIEMEDDEVGKYWFSFTADLESGKVLKYDLGWHRDPPLDVSMVDVYIIDDVVREMLDQVHRTWGKTPEDIRSELEGGFGIDESRHDSQWTDAVDRHTRMRALAKRQGDEEKFNYHHNELRKLYGKDMATTPDGTFNDDPGGIKIDEIGVPPVSPVFPMRRELPKRTPHFPDPKKKISENLTPEDAQQLWIKNYGEEMAERVFYNIKDELLHAVSDLKSIRTSACDTQDRLEAMSRVEFARWLLTYFTDALEQYNWPEAHSEGIAQVIRDQVRQPLLNKQCLLELVEPHEPGYQHDILTMPANTLVIDTPGELDWYKIGQHFPNLSKEDPHEYGQSESDMVMSFASPEEMNKFAKVARRLGLKIKSIGGGYEHPEIHAEPKLENFAGKQGQYLAARYVDEFGDGDHWYVKGSPQTIKKFVMLANSLEDEMVKGTEYEPGVGSMAQFHKQLTGSDAPPQWTIVSADNLEELEPLPDLAIKVLGNPNLSKGVGEFMSEFLWKLESKGMALMQPDMGDITENFADGKKPGRKGLAKRMGVPTKASVSRLRQIAKSSSGEKARMAHFIANMKAGRKKDK